ncbi:hypothetical protein BV898_18229 [Hypsibius exemplaris]|uniref:Uncharacterized protein n=1 Tax=Hypsibius exemplaris TaxID=2072580 RepID=A0A9X6NH01_HYPEX|nr:hypothetical protein BV898_18229 [Hypsibius exemplaris]
MLPNKQVRETVHGDFRASYCLGYYGHDSVDDMPMQMLPQSFRDEVARRLQLEVAPTDVLRSLRTAAWKTFEKDFQREVLRRTVTKAPALMHHMEQLTMQKSINDSSKKLLCTWHVLKNVTQKINGYVKKPDKAQRILSAFRSVIHGHLRFLIANRVNDLYEKLLEFSWQTKVKRAVDAAKSIPSSRMVADTAEHETTMANLADHDCVPASLECHFKRIRDFVDFGSTSSNAVVIEKIKAISNYIGERHSSNGDSGRSAMNNKLKQQAFGDNTCHSIFNVTNGETGGLLKYRHSALVSQSNATKARLIVGSTIATGFVDVIESDNFISQSFMEVFRLIETLPFNSPKCRIRLITGNSGFYTYSTTMPGRYASPVLGPDFRAVHVHVKVTSLDSNNKPTGRTLTLLQYFVLDMYMGKKDVCTECRSDDPTLITHLHHSYDIKTFDGVILRGNNFGNFNLTELLNAYPNLTVVNLRNNPYLQCTALESMDFIVLTDHCPYAIKKATSTDSITSPIPTAVLSKKVFEVVVLRSNDANTQQIKEASKMTTIGTL